MAKPKYTIQDIEIGNLVDFQRKQSVNIYKDCEVLGKLDYNLLIVSMPGIKENIIIDINEVIEVRSKHS